MPAARSAVATTSCEPVPAPRLPTRLLARPPARLRVHTPTTFPPARLAARPAAPACCRAFNAKHLAMKAAIMSCLHVWGHLEGEERRVSIARDHLAEWRDMCSIEELQRLARGVMLRMRWLPSGLRLYLLRRMSIAADGYLHDDYMPPRRCDGCGMQCHFLYRCDRCRTQLFCSTACLRHCWKRDAGLRAACRAAQARE